MFVYLEFLRLSRLARENFPKSQLCYSSQLTFAGCICILRPWMCLLKGWYTTTIRASLRPGTAIRARAEARSMRSSTMRAKESINEQVGDRDGPGLHGYRAAIVLCFCFNVFGIFLYI